MCINKDYIYYYYCDLLGHNNKYGTSTIPTDMCYNQIEDTDMIDQLKQTAILIELTVYFETNFAISVLRKENR